jgi:CubicO group peptidase (beta-lactamase class C family)
MKLKPHILTALPVTVFLLLPIAIAVPASADLERRIQRVETGLQPPVVIKGRTLSNMTVADRLKFYKVPGVSIAVISGGKLEWARGYGVTAAHGGKSVSPETLFQAASISKPFAAMIALHLVDQGKLSLDEDVNVRLHSWKVPESQFTKTERVTLRRLLNHSAGMTVDGFDGYASIEPVPTLLQTLDGIKPANNAPIRVDTTPGTQWNYSGGGYVVVQQLVEDVTDKPFQQLAREFVLAPLGMSHSTYEQPLSSGYQAAAAVGHDGDGAQIKGKWYTYPELAPAGLWTTPSDLALLVLEIQSGGGHVLKPSTQREMLTKVLGNYGLGLYLGEKNGDKSFSHSGANNGFKCDMFAFLGSGRGAIIMANGDRGSALIGEIFRSIVAEYDWPDYKSIEKTVVSVSQDVLRSYDGEYELTNGTDRIVVSFEEGHLYFKPSGLRNQTELFPESDTSFFTLLRRVPPVRFNRKDDGSIELITGGMTAKRK